MIASLFNCRYDGHWSARPLKPMFLALMPFHYVFLFIVGLLFFVMAVAGTISDGLPLAIGVSEFYGAAVCVYLLWNRWRYVLSDKGIIQRGEAVERNDAFIAHHSSKWYSRYALAAFMILVGIWLWDVKGDNWILRIASVVYFGWALYVAREIGILVLVAIVIALVMWFFTALPPIPTAIIIGAIIIAAAIRDRR